MIEELNAEELAMIPVIRDKWLAIGLSTQPMNKEKIAPAITDAYKVGGLPAPKDIIYLASPMQGAQASALLSTEEGAAILRLLNLTEEEGNPPPRTTKTILFSMETLPMLRVLPQRRRPRMLS